MGSNPTDLIALDSGSPYNFKTQGWIASTASGGVTTYDINFAYITSSTQVSNLDFTVPGTSTTYTDYYTGDTIGPHLAADFDVEISSDIQAAIQTILAPAGTVADTNYFSDVSNISFTKQDPTDASVQIDIGTTTDANNELPLHGGANPLAASLSTSLYNPGEYGDIWLNTSSTEVTWSSAAAFRDSEAFEDLIHELGHSLGLIHPTDAGGNNSLYYTVMTGTGWELPGMSVGVSGLQMDDIRAIQSIYGANYSVRSGADMYGVGHGFGDSSSYQFVDTIWDGGGTNIIDASSYTGPSVINLNQASFSSIGPGNTNGGSWSQPLGASYNGIAFDNVAIAYGTVIQNAIGTQGATTFIGNLWDDVLAGAPSSSGNLFYSDQSITPSEIPGVNWSYQAGTAGSQWTVPTAQYIAAPSDLSDKGAVLIGDGTGNTFISGLGWNVIDGGYNKSDITNATHAVLGGSIWGASGTSTYWDSAYQFTGDPSTITTGNPNGTAHNISGVPLANIADSGSTGNTVDYSKLSLEDSEITPGSGVGILLIKSSLSDAGGAPEYTVIKNDAADGEDTLINVQYILGSGGDDTFVLPNGTGGAPLSISETGSGDNTYILPVTTAPSYSGGAYINGDIFINDTTGHGNVVLQGSPGATVTGIDIGYFASPEYWMPSSDFSSSDKILGISVNDGVNGTAYAYFDMTTAAAGTGVSNIEIGGLNFSAQTLASYTLALANGFSATTPADLYSDLYGTGPSNLLPGPVYDTTTGQITGMAAPSYVSSGAGDFIGGSIAVEIDHPWVITGYSGPLGGPGTTIINLQTSIEAAWMKVDSSDVRIVWSGPTTDILTVYAVSEAESFTVTQFKNGVIIYGIGILGNEQYDAVSSHLTGLSASSPGNYTGDFSDTTGIVVGSGFHVTYYLEELIFDDGSSWSMQSGPLTFTAAIDSQNLYSRDGFNDTLVADCNYNNLTGSSGNTTMIAGVGCVINNGTGTDLDIFAAGVAPVSYGGDYVYANTSGGTASIHLQGIDPSAVTMWDTVGGALAIQYSSTDVIHVQGGTYSSTTGLTLQGVSEITFDSSYATTISLTGGLTLTAAADSQTLYGTNGGGDTLTANGTYDTLMAFAGTETLVAGQGATLYNGAGTDTDVFSAGAAPISSGGDYVYTNTSGGTGIIHLHGIDPGAVTMWDTTGGALTIQYSSTDVIHIQGGTYSSSTGLTLAGLSEITFDSSYATTWDTTGGLHLTAASDYQALYGTSGGGDTLTATGTGDTLMAFAGAETLVAGHGAQIYNGTGNDIDVINSGASPASSSATIYTNASGGSDNVIALHDVVAGDIAMWDTTGGNLIIATPSDQVIVSGGSYNSSTGFAIGNIDHIALDDTSTIGLQGGLNLTAVSDSQTIYGTGHGDNLSAAGNYDNLYGIAGNNTMTGDSGMTYFYGGSGNDTMVAGSGTNYMTMGTGADEIKIESASSSTTVSGFSVSNGDTIHVEDVISSYDPVHDAIADFVQETTSGSNTQFSVDPSGSGSFTAGPVLTLSGVTGLDDVATLVAHGSLVVHA